VHTEVSPTVFPHILNGVSITSATLRELKDRENYVFILLIKDNLIDLVTEKDDLA
jgi:hypothetical protein